MTDYKLRSHYRFEDLPNELFYQVQSYLYSTEFYESFSNLNFRFNALLMSINNLHLEIRSTVDHQRLTTASFASRIVSIRVPDNSDAVSIAAVFPNVRSLSFHRAIRLIPKTFPIVERIKVDLSKMRPKHGIGLCHLIFSNCFSSLISFHIVHRKVTVVGHWRPLIDSIHHQCLTLTKFIFDIQPTVEWSMLEHFLKQMPHLQILIIRKLNTRSRWTLSYIAHILKINVPHLNFLFIRVTSLGTGTIVKKDDDFHPLFVHITSKKGNSRKLFTTTIISSRQ
jgi:hypothetical protein